MAGALLARALPEPVLLNRSESKSVIPTANVLYCGPQIMMVVHRRVVPGSIGVHPAGDRRAVLRETLYAHT